MSLPQHARILPANQYGAPAEEVLRFVQPFAYLPVLRKALQAYSPKAAADGLEFVGILPGKSAAASRGAAEKRRPSGGHAQWPHFESRGWRRRRSIARDRVGAVWSSSSRVPTPYSDVQVPALVYERCPRHV